MRKPYAGIAALEADAAVAAGLNLMLWHEVTAGICQLQARLLVYPVLLCCIMDTALLICTRSTSLEIQ